MQEMQKELSMNFPFYEPQNSPKAIPSYQMSQPQPQPNQNSYQPQPIQPLKNDFEKPSSGEDEINMLNSKSMSLIFFK